MIRYLRTLLCNNAASTGEERLVPRPQSHRICVTMTLDWGGGGVSALDVLASNRSVRAVPVPVSEAGGAGHPGSERPVGIVSKTVQEMPQ